MTAPVIEPVEMPAEPAVEEVAPADAGEWAVRFPVMAVEHLDTSDGRYLTPGQIMSRACPMTILAQPFSSHGGAEPPYAVTVGRLDSMERVPGPSVVSRATGEPFGEGTFVWVGHGAVDPTIDVHGLNIGNLLKRRFLNGASVDLAGMDVEMVGEGGLAADPEHPRRQMIAHSAEIAAITLCPIPAFGDAYVELVDQDVPDEPVAPEDLPEGFCASAFPAWRSAEVGDYPALVAAGEEEHTGGMIALVPANPDELTVEGGEPAEEIHLTLAYLGEDVTGWGEDERATVLDHVRGWAADTAPIEADVMGWALFNPTGANDREPCAVHLVAGAGLLDAKGAMGDHDTSEHPVWIPHMTAGYGVTIDALSFIGPITFDRVRVALAGESEVFELGTPSADVSPVEEEPTEAVVADAGALRGRWNPGDHPRDRRGRWIDKGGRVTLDDGTKGTVIDDDAGDGDVRVKADNGVQVRVRGEDIDVDDDDQPDATPSGPDDADPDAAKRTATADKVTRARDAKELKDIVAGMDDDELKAADEEMTDRAALLGRPGAVSRGHQAVKDAIEAKGGTPTPSAPQPPAKPTRKPRTDRGLTPPKPDTSTPHVPDDLDPGNAAGRRVADRIQISSSPKLAVKEVSTADLHGADREFERRAILLGGDRKKVTGTHKVIKAELKKRGEEPIVAAANFAEEFPDDDLDMPADEVGMPDAPQPCEATGESAGEGGDGADTYEVAVQPHPATRSLMFGDDRYVAVCEDHDEWAREQIAAEGGEVTGVVEIVQSDTDEAEEIPA